MGFPHLARSAACSGLLSAIVVIVAVAPLAQRQSPAGRPWSGQAQCVVVAKSADYQDEQTHTWTLTGAAPTPAPVGSAQVYYMWPATWSVQGSGRKAFPSRAPGAASGDQVERWTIASQQNLSLRMTEVAAGTERLRIGAEGQRGAPLGSIRVTEVSGRTRDASVQPWPFPAIEDNATGATISGTSTRTYPEGFGVGWGQPPKAITTATCTWNFTSGAVDQSSANKPTSGRGTARGALAGAGASGSAGAATAGAPSSNQPAAAGVSGTSLSTVAPGTNATTSSPGVVGPRTIELAGFGASGGWVDVGHAHDHAWWLDRNWFIDDSGSDQAMNYRTCLMLAAICVLAMTGVAEAQNDVTFVVPLNLSDLSPEIYAVQVECRVRSDAIPGGSYGRVEGFPVVDRRVARTATLRVQLSTLNNPAGKNATYVCTF